MKSKSIVLATVLPTAMAAPIFANQEHPLQPQTFGAADVQHLFEHNGKPMQLAALSQREMQETEGAWAPLLYYWSPALTSASYALYNSSPRLGGTINSIQYSAIPAYNRFSIWSNSFTYSRVNSWSTYRFY